MGGDHGSNSDRTASHQSACRVAGLQGYASLRMVVPEGNMKVFQPRPEGPGQPFVIIPGGKERKKARRFFTRPDMDTWYGGSLSDRFDSNCAPGPSETARGLARQRGCNAHGSRTRSGHTIKTRRVGRHNQETRGTHVFPWLSGPLAPTLDEVETIVKLVPRLKRPSTQKAPARRSQGV